VDKNWKVIFNLWQTMKTHRGSKFIAVLFLEPRQYMGWVVKATPRLFYPVKENQYILHGRLGGPLGRSGRVRKISSTPGFDRRTLQYAVRRCTDCYNPTKANLQILNNTGKVLIM
jgi:hypothetical protein